MDNREKRLGFIAQEVQTVLPAVVTGTETETEFLNVCTTDMIPLLVKSIQELTARVNILESKL